jgi:integrase
MLTSGEELPKAQNLPVATLCDLFLDYSQAHHSAGAYESYRRFLQSFCDAYGTLSAGDIKPFHVTRWLDSHKTWQGARRHAVISIKRAFSWGEQQGLIPGSPIRSLKVPRVRRRERVLTPDERTLILSEAKDKAFKNFLTALLGTGCRPSEVAGVTAAEVNLELGVWVLTQHKTARKTGKPRIIYLSPEMLALTKQQMTEHPTGPLFPNRLGKQFTRNAWRCRFRRLRENHPGLAGVVCYTLRSTFATNALENGVGLAHVAELLGHSGTEMVMQHYQLLSANVGKMREAAAKATQG